MNLISKIIVNSLLAVALFFTLIAAAFKHAEQQGNTALVLFLIAIALVLIAEIFF